MELWPGEPPGGPWRRERLEDVIGRLMDGAEPPRRRPFLLGVDGRSSSGKTSLAARIHAAVTPSAVVHSDDIAWHHSVFGWNDMMIDGVLGPLRRGEAVCYRPPAWEERGREGAVEVPGGCRLVVVEGVGAGRRELAPLLDAVVWVRADRRDVELREASRVASGEVAKVVQERWAAEELPFVADQRPWERAAVLVSGTPDLPLAEGQILVWWPSQ